MVALNRKTFMKIAIDARFINTSTGRYVERLLTYLEKLDAPHDFMVIVPSKDKTYWRPTKPNFRVITHDAPSYTFAEQLNFALFLYAQKVDLVHFCMPQQPLLYFGKRITTIHDLTLVRFDNIDMNPLVYRARKLIFTLLLKNVIWRSKAILTPTEYVRQDVLKFSSPRYINKVIPTLEAWDQIADQPEEISALKNKPFIFFVGNAFPYKNHKLIVDAFKHLYDTYPDLQLVFTGKKDIFYERIADYVAQSGVAGRTHILGYVSEGEKRWLFQHGTAYVVASLSEGFHIPGLEAMAENCPVISSNATCLPEVYANAALYFDPHDATELAEKITLVLTNPNVRQELITAGNKRLKDFSWKRMAEQTLAQYNQSSN
jgi:glycosyltransferase involved in cell wall biosynthesis